ncbi:MAG: hypothetical protein LBP20_07665 [Treponema sp.]|jgi:uncharacterized membrane protein|nr:hypothetical protein [Treponema sp.]
MLFVIIPFSVVLLGVIVYFALSPRSSKGLRLAALAALGAIMLAIVICAVIVFTNQGTVEEGPVMPDFYTASAPQSAPKGNSLILLLLAVFLLVFLGVVVFLAMKERQRQQRT